MGRTKLTDTTGVHRAPLIGDTLLYDGSGLISALIRLKTWAPVSHVEVYAGASEDGGRVRHWAYAARMEDGVRLYPFEPEGLAVILRPAPWVASRFRWLRAVRYAESAIGQPYDYWGLVRFFRRGQETRHSQFCSEFATRFYRAGGLEPFARDYPADLVSPGMYLASPAFQIVRRRVPPYPPRFTHA